jgi:hypothetical protein
VSCLSATSCIAVGGYTNAAGTQLALVQTWNGTSWTQDTPGPISASLASVSCSAATDCMAVGGFESARWDGTSWTTQSTPMPTAQATGGLGAISCTSSTFCMAVGSTPPSTLAEAWKGTSWTTQSTPNNGLQGPEGNGGDWLSDVSCTGANACTAVGAFSAYHEGGVLAASWDGKTWTPQAVGPGGVMVFALLNGVSCLSTTDCTAVGTSWDALAETWDGTSWTVENLPTPSGAAGLELGTNPVSLNSVSCTSATTCTAVGSYTTTNIGRSTQLIEQSS